MNNIDKATMQRYIEYKRMRNLYTSIIIAVANSIWKERYEKRS